MKATYLALGNTPSDITLHNPFYNLMDSVMKTLPDSTRRSIENNKVEQKQKHLQMLDEVYREYSSLVYIQVKIGKQWIDVIIDKENDLISRLIIPRVDTDPIFGNGPQNYKEIILFSDYKDFQGFLLPGFLSEATDKDEFAVRRQLDWLNLNSSFSDKTFAAEPSYEDKIKYRISELGDQLFVIEDTGGSIHSRILLRMAADNRIDLFISLVFNEAINEKLRKALADRFPGSEIRNIFSPESISNITALSSLFDKKTKLYVPKGIGYMADTKLRTMPTLIMRHYS